MIQKQETATINVSTGISSVSPSSGSENGGQTLTIDGMGLRGAVLPTVTINLESASVEVDPNSGTAILVTTPMGSGAATIIVTRGELSVWVCETSQNIFIKM
jgi:streptogramin lyase